MNTSIRYARTQVNLAKAYLMRHEVTLAFDCLMRATDGLDSADDECDDLRRQLDTLTVTVESWVSAQKPSPN